MKQLKLFREKQNLEFGGSLRKGKRKSRRPLSAKLPHHKVLKASSSYTLLRHRKEIERIIRQLSERFGIQLYDLAIHADHVHLPTGNLQREAYKKWIRALTGILARKFKIKWRLRPYSRIVSWGRQFATLLKYVEKNKTEGNFMLDAHLTMEEAKSRWFNQTAALI